MNVLIGADHRGFMLKEQLKKWLTEKGYQVTDTGSAQLEPEDDYPVISFSLAEKLLATEEAALAILCCGSGVGATVAANKVPDIRCGLGLSAQQVAAGRHDDDMNVLALAADFTSLEDAQKMVEAFLTTAFGNEPRYQRRLDQIYDREHLT